MRDNIDLAKVTGPHLLVSFQYGEDLRAVRLVFNIGEVDNVPPILWLFFCVRLAIDPIVLR